MPPFRLPYEVGPLQPEVLQAAELPVCLAELLVDLLDRVLQVVDGMLQDRAVVALHRRLLHLRRGLRVVLPGRLDSRNGLVGTALGGLADLLDLFAHGGHMPVQLLGGPLDVVAVLRIVASLDVRTRAQVEGSS